MTSKKKKPYVDYDDYLIERLKNDPEEAIGYLKAAFEESDMPEVFFSALRNVAEAYGMTQLARKTKLTREGLYKILSKKGNPRYSSLQSILDAFGLRLTLEEKKAS